MKRFLATFSAVLLTLVSMTAPAFTAPEGLPITEQPAGKSQLCSCDSYGYYLYVRYVVYGQQTGLPASYVIGDDGFYYIFNPITGYTTNSYLKCEKRGDKLVAALPQPILVNVYGDDTVIHYAAMIDMAKDEYGNNVGRANDETEIIFDLAEDGKISYNLDYDSTPDSEGNLPLPSKIFGMCSADGTWVTAGDAEMSMTPTEVHPVEVPEGIEVEQASFVYSDGGHLVGLGFIDDAVYVKGFSKSFPEAWIKGSVDGNKVTFESKQYLGIYQKYFIHFMGGVRISDSEFDIADKAVFIYDSEKKTLVPEDDKTCMIANAALDKLFFLDLYQDAKFILPSDDMDYTPQNPLFTGYFPYYQDFGYNAIQFILSYTNEDGFILDTSNMYYEIRIDGEVHTFAASDFGAEEDITEIPWDFNSSGNGGTGPSKTIYLRFNDYSTVGVQLFYEHDGKLYKTPVVVYDVESGEQSVGIGNITEEGLYETGPAEYYNLSGMRVENPENGIFIRRATMNDGSVKTTKVIR